VPGDAAPPAQRLGTRTSGCLWVLTAFAVCRPFVPLRPVIELLRGRFGRGWSGLVRRAGGRAAGLPIPARAASTSSTISHSRSRVWSVVGAGVVDSASGGGVVGVFRRQWGDWVVATSWGGRGRGDRRNRSCSWRAACRAARAPDRSAVVAVVAGRSSSLSAPVKPADSASCKR
jgi:hypothetical protein